MHRLKPVKVSRVGKNLLTLNKIDIVHTELARAYNQGAFDGVKAAIDARLMNHCEMIWSTAGTNRVCGRCLSLKDTVVGRTDEQGVQIPPLHPRCHYVIVYRESSRSRDRGLAAGNSINLETGGKSPYLVSMINPKDAAQIKQALDWFEANAVTAPVENALIITTSGEIYHCTGKLNTLADCRTWRQTTWRDRHAQSPRRLRQ